MDQWQLEQLLADSAGFIESAVKNAQAAAFSLAWQAATPRQRLDITMKFTDATLEHLESLNKSQAHWLCEWLQSRPEFVTYALDAEKVRLSEAVVSRAVKEIGRAEFRGYGSNDLGNTLQEATREAAREMAADVLQEKRDEIRAAVAQKLSKMIVEKAVADHARALLDAALKEPE